LLATASSGSLGIFVYTNQLLTSSPRSTNANSQIETYHINLLFKYPDWTENKKSEATYPESFSSMGWLRSFRDNITKTLNSQLIPYNKSIKLKNNGKNVTVSEVNNE
jgi:hypothetical protein